MFEGKLLPALAISLIIFLGTIWLGMAAANLENEAGELVRQQVNEIAEKLSGQIRDENPFVITLNIFFNNLRACVLLFLGGASFGLLTLFILGLNGALIGAIVALKVPEKGIIWVSAALVPHGIFEIPAILIASGLGLLLAEELVRELQGTGNAAAAAVKLGRRFVLQVIPLLAVAAVIEAFITPQIVNLVI